MLKAYSKAIMTLNADLQSTPWSTLNRLHYFLEGTQTHVNNFNNLRKKSKLIIIALLPLHFKKNAYCYLTILIESRAWNDNANVPNETLSSVIR